MVVCTHIVSPTRQKGVVCSCLYKPPTMAPIRCPRMIISMRTWWATIKCRDSLFSWKQTLWYIIAIFLSTVALRFGHVWSIRNFNARWRFNSSGSWFTEMHVVHCGSMSYHLYIPKDVYYSSLSPKNGLPRLELCQSAIWSNFLSQKFKIWPWKVCSPGSAMLH